MYIFNIYKYEPNSSFPLCMNLVPTTPLHPLLVQPTNQIFQMIVSVSEISVKIKPYYQYFLMTIFFCILLLFQFAKILWTVELIMLPWFVTKMAYILTGPGDIVNRIVDIAKVFRLCSDTVLSFFKFQLNNRLSEWLRHFLYGKLHT